MSFYKIYGFMINIKLANSCETDLAYTCHTVYIITPSIISKQDFQKYLFIYLFIILFTFYY